METRRYLTNVWEALQEDFRSAVSILAEADVADFADEIAEGYAKEYNKDLKRRAAQDRSLAPHYKGVPDSIAKWGKEAHAYGLHAHGMEKGGKAPRHKMVAAHAEAGKAHHFAHVKLDNAGHKDQADMHKRAAKYHRQKVSVLGGDDIDEGASDDLRAANTHAHMAQWRASQLKKKLAVKASSSKPQLKYAAVVKKPTPIGEGIADFFFLGEGYEDAVKQASINAARRTKTAQSADDHKQAATLHGIAADIAKAHGHDDLAGKHAAHKQKHLDSFSSLKKSVSG